MIRGLAEGPAHMTAEEFRRAGYALVDWIAAYHERVGDLPVLSRARPGELLDALPSSAPEAGESFDAILADVDRLIVPGLTHWQSPSFFGFFPANASPPAILGELLSAGLGVQGMLWATSPAVTELEVRVLDWLAELCGLPERFRSTGLGGGVIQDSASSASLCALLAAASRAGGDRAHLVAYTSEHAHSSIEKDARIAGITVLRSVATDAEFAMRPDALADAMAEDVAAGRRPFFVAATVGTTSSCAIDPVEAVADVAASHGAWLHVDAAYAGSAAVCPEHRTEVLAGVDRADSYVFNPHKWLLTNFDCSAFYVADRGALLDALSITPEYLRNQASESGAVVDYRDWQVPLGRRFRALKLWFVLRCYGADGLRRHIRHHVALARDFAGRVADDPDWELAAPPRLGLVCFRAGGAGVRADALNQRILDECNRAGRMYLTHTRLGGRLALRMAIGGTRTQASNVNAAWDELRRARRLALAG